MKINYSTSLYRVEENKRGMRECVALHYVTQRWFGLLRTQTDFFYSTSSHSAEERCPLLTACHSGPETPACARCIPVCTPFRPESQRYI